MNKLNIFFYLFVFFILQTKSINSLKIKTNKLSSLNLLKFNQKNISELEQQNSQNKKDAEKNNSLNEIDKKDVPKNRLLRFLWSFLLVILFVIAVFLIVKNSVDWATSGRGEINKFNEQKMKKVLEALNKEFLI